MILEIFYQEDIEFINSWNYSLLISECAINPGENWTNYINIYKR
jgi:hypothetical protein